MRHEGTTNGAFVGVSDRGDAEPAGSSLGAAAEVELPRDNKEVVAVAFAVVVVVVDDDDDDGACKDEEEEEGAAKLESTSSRCIVLRCFRLGGFSALPPLLSVGVVVEEEVIVRGSSSNFRQHCHRKLHGSDRERKRTRAAEEEEERLQKSWMGSLYSVHPK